MTEQTPLPSKTLTIRDRINLGYVVFFFIMLPLLSHAGGLGMAIFAAVGGGIAFLTRPSYDIKSIPIWCGPLALFIIWACLSSFWSPYEDPHTLSNSFKLAVGAFLYIALSDGIARAVKAAPIWLKHLFMAMAVLALGLLFIDLLSRNGLTFLFDPLNTDENIVAKTSDIEMNLGHSITILAVLLAPVMVLMSRTFKYGNIMAGAFVIALFIGSYLNNLAIGQLAAVVTLAAMGAAKLWPLRTVKSLTGLAVISILFAPIIGVLAGLIPDEGLAKFPFSWEHRLVMWDYIVARIAEAPLIGHGFDAVRTFDETFSTRGFEDLNIIWLHPHSTGLHIWAETGFIGASLAAATLGTFGYTTLQHVKKNTDIIMPLAGFLAATILICTVTYGVWQEWWWATMIVATSMFHFFTKPSEPTQASAKPTE